MQPLPTASLELEEPHDYFHGVGHDDTLPIPTNILVFKRLTRRTLQQEALLNRSHHRFVLILNLETTGHVHVDNRVIPLASGQSALILPFQFHHFTELESPHLKWLFCTFELSSDAFPEPLRYRVLNAGADTQAAWQRLLTLWQRCRTEAPSAEQAPAMLQIALLQLLLSLKQDLVTQAEDLPPSPPGSLLRRIHRHLAQWRGRPVSVTDIADALELSPSRLRAVFRTTAGVPLGAYLLNYRLNRAMALLRTTDLPIAEIAEEAGFGSPQAFSRVFKAKLGTTPRTYRHTPR